MCYKNGLLTDSRLNLSRNLLKFPLCSHEKCAFEVVYSPINDKGLKSLAAKQIVLIDLHLLPTRGLRFCTSVLSKGLR